MVSSKSTRFSFPAPRPRRVRLVGFSVALLVAGFASGCAQTGSPDDLAYGRGKNALAAARHDDARSYLAKTVARDPRHSGALHHACLAWSTGPRQDPARVIESCRAYLEHASGPAVEDTEWDDVVARLITALVSSGETAQARAWTARLRDPVTAATTEASLWLADDPSRSLAVLAPTLAADPEHARFHDVAAAVYQALGRDDEALHHLERSQAVDPLRSGLYQRLAGLAARVGDAERVALETARAATLARYEALAETDSETDAERLKLLIGLDESFPRRHPLIRFAKARLELRLGHTDRGRKRVEGLVRQKLLTDGQRLALAALFR